MFRVVNFDALGQTSDFRIERRQVVFLCWNGRRRSDATPSFIGWANTQKDPRASLVKALYLDPNKMAAIFSADDVYHHCGFCPGAGTSVSCGLSVDQGNSYHFNIVEMSFQMFWYIFFPAKKRPGWAQPQHSSAWQSSSGGTNRHRTHAINRAYIFTDRAICMLQYPEIYSPWKSTTCNRRVTPVIR